LKNTIYILPFLVLLTLSAFISSCKKDQLFSSNKLSFSVDTVLFDTVFTTIGSVTKRYKIYNTENKPVNISKVTLAGGESSPYRINLDGVSGTQFKDITIPADDSLFMFVEVTLGENNINDPFIIEDSVLFKTNGKDQSVLLAAWGQNAYFHSQELINTGTWLSDKPHVIYDLAVVNPNQTLTIEAGAHIYMHKQTILYINKGKLIMNGTATDKIIVEGDRLESFYEDVKGQYYGIYFDHALSSSINHAIIKNGTAGIHILGDNVNNTNPTLSISNTEIFNHASYGIFNYSGGRIEGSNLSVYNNGQYAFFLLEGGDYNFRHCDFLGYGTDGDQPAIVIKNYFTREDGITYVGAVNEGAIYNSIVYGSGKSQYVYDTITQNGSVDVNYDFNNNFIKREGVPSNSSFTDNTWNTNPRFKNVGEQNFKLKSNSPCIDSGKLLYSVSPDIDGVMRTPPPDIGAYEFN